MKSWWQSKTVWFNAVVMLLAIVPIVGGFLKVVMPETAVMIDAVLAMVAGIGNVILRVWFTDAPIATTARQEQVALENRSNVSYPQPK